MNAPRDWTLLCLSCGAVVALSRLFSCSWVPGPGPLVSGYLGTWVSGYLGIWVSGYLGIWVSGYLGIWVSGYLGIWVSGYLGIWVSGYLGIWVSGYLGIWVSGYLGIPENQLFWGTRKKLAIWSDMPENKLRNSQRYPKYPKISSDIGQLCPIFENGASLTNI